MNPPTMENKYPFDRPGTYCIRIIGFLDESWSEKFAGMRISTESVEEQEPITTLVGPLPDQAALAGILESLYELHFTLLSVEKLEGKSL